jgi:hypothetical protein
MVFLPTEPGIYWCSISGSDWDSFLEVFGRVPYLQSRVIFLRCYPTACSQPVDSRNSLPKKLGPKIDYPTSDSFSSSSDAGSPLPEFT